MLIKDYMKKEFVIVNKNLPLTTALDILLKKIISHIILVSNNKKLVGIVSEKDILNKLATERTWHVDLGKMHISSFVKSKPLTINENETVKNVIRLFVEGKIGILPILDKNGNIIGIVTKHDLLPLLFHENENIKNILNPKPITALPFERFQEIKLKITTNSISLIPVFDEGKIRGIITDIGVMQALTSFYKTVPWKFRKERIRKLYASDIMDRNFKKANPHMDIASLARLFYEENLKGIIVVENDTFMGLITKTDLLKTLM